MVDQELLAAISAMMDEKLEARLGPMEQQLRDLAVSVADLKEGQAEIRSGNNALLSWADTVGVLVHVPLRPSVD